MKVNQARERTDQALEKLASALEQGKSAALTAYLSTMSRFHSYSFGNVMLIMSQSPDATRVAGFQTWKKLGRFVKKGEKGILVLAPMLFRKSPDGDGDDETALRFKAAHVFDISQTDGEELPEPTRVAGDPGQNTDLLKAFAASRGIGVDYSTELGGADGLSRGGAITLKQGLPLAEEFSVLAHELAHELLHRGDGRPDSKTARETEAEAVAFVLGEAVGLDTGCASSDYIQLYQGSKETLAASLDRIQRAATTLIQALAPPSE